MSVDEKLSRYSDATNWPSLRNEIFSNRAVNLGIKMIYLSTKIFRIGLQCIYLFGKDVCIMKELFQAYNGRNAI